MTRPLGPSETWDASISPVETTAIVGIIAAECPFPTCTQARPLGLIPA